MIGQKRWGWALDCSAGNHFVLVLCVGLFGVALLPVHSTAQEVRVNVHTLSWHIEKSYLNDRTWGGGAEVTWTSSSWTYGLLGGTYYNSHWNLALYLGLSGGVSITDGVHMGIGLAGATGYEFYGVVCLDAPWRSGKRQWCFRPDWTRLVMPMLWPFVSVGDRVQLRLLASPFMGGVGHFMVSLRLN